MSEEIKEEVKGSDAGGKAPEGNAKNNIKEVLEGVDIADGGANFVSGIGESTEKSAGGEAVQNGTSSDLSDEVSRLKKEVESMKDAWTRERAEFMNYKKRMAQEQARYRGEIIGEFAKNLFPIMDNLERVLQVESSDENLKNFLSGVDMIKKEFITVLERESIRQLNPLNQGFDPFRMEAIAMEDRNDLDKDTVVEVFQYGYLYEKDENESKVLRPARVKVSKKS